MSTRTRGIKRLRRSALLVALLCGAALACGGEDTSNEELSAPRLLDTLCYSGSYELTGDADVTTGLSDDSCGFLLGPGPGALRLVLSSTMASSGVPVSTVGLEALVGEDNGDAFWTTAYFSPTDPAVLANPEGHTLRVLDIRVRMPTGSGCN